MVLESQEFHLNFLCEQPWSSCRCRCGFGTAQMAASIPSTPSSQGFCLHSFLFVGDGAGSYQGKACEQ